MVYEASPELLAELSDTAREIRRDIIRMTNRPGGADPGGSLSAADLVTALVFHELHLDPKPPDRPDRDRLVLSNGEATPALHAALALRGYQPLEDPERGRTPGSRTEAPANGRMDSVVDVCAGGVGEGIGVAVGMTLDARLAGRTNRVYALVGGGEAESGPAWESLLAGGRCGLDNLVVVLDLNRSTPERGTEAAQGVEPIGEKLRAFRFETLEIDGHDFGEILAAFARAREVHGRPTAIVARTVRGKGVSSMESAQGLSRRPTTRREVEGAMAELGRNLE